MNTKAIGAAAEVIFRALAKDGVVPATVAVALDANGLLAGPDAAAETLALRAHIAELRSQLTTSERQARELDERLAERDEQIASLLHGADADFDEQAVPA